MAELFINSVSKKLLDTYLKDPPHALCLSGDRGVGLGSVAAMLGEKLSGNSQSVMSIVPEKGLISIERVRQLYTETRSIQHKPRCIIIDDADAMSPDAQHALLKLLEEPAKNVHFILTTHHVSRLLATILSRTQQVTLLPIEEAKSKQLLSRFSLSPTEQAQALFLASGQPAELTRLASNPEYFTARTILVMDARTFLQSDTYGRLGIVKGYTERKKALEFLRICALLLSFSLLKQQNLAAAPSMEAMDRAMKRIEANGHVRTHLMHLVTKLP